MTDLERWLQTCERIYVLEILEFERMSAQPIVLNRYSYDPTRFRALLEWAETTYSVIFSEEREVLIRAIYPHKTWELCRVANKKSIGSIK
jgi:hypothetical protein